MMRIKHSWWLIVLAFGLGASTVAVAGFYAISGRPWGSRVRPEVQQVSERNRFRTIADLAREAVRLEGPLDGRQLGKIMVEHGISAASIEFDPPAIHYDSIVVIGQEPDVDGFVWAVTSEGALLKIRKDEGQHKGAGTVGPNMAR